MGRDDLDSWSNPSRASSLRRRYTELSFLCGSGCVFFLFGLPLCLAYLSGLGVLNISYQAFIIMTLSGWPIGLLCLALSFKYMSRFVGLPKGSIYK
jgi:hypothetical protein